VRDIPEVHDVQLFVEEDASQPGHMVGIGMTQDEAKD
jgi:hypothetical protein